MTEKKKFDFKHPEPASTKPDPVTGTITNEKNIPKYGMNSPTIKPKAEPRNRRMQLLLTNSNYIKLKEYATTCGTSMNDAVNQMIEKLYI